MVTEANFSANAGAPFHDVVGALWFADFAGSFLSSGGKALYLYQYTPEALQQTASGCVTWGSYGRFVGSPSYGVRQTTAQYFAAQVIMQHWAQPVDMPHALVGVAMQPSNQTITAYALRRPDAKYAVLLLNKNQWRVYTVHIVFHRGSITAAFRGPVTQMVFGKAQYAWHQNGANRFAGPDGPAVTSAGPPTATYALPPESISVLSGNLK